MDQGEAREALIGILRLAYSGELAAMLAYQGHALSVSSPAERDEIRKIEEDERRHRARVGEMLAELGASISPLRELKMRLIGLSVNFACRLTGRLPGGWFFAMYGAGRLESRNIVEYEHAARYARQAGKEAFVADLLEMARVEWDHEKYFHDKIRSHALYQRVPAWPAPPPRAAIDRSFAAFGAETNLVQD